MTLTEARLQYELQYERDQAWDRINGLRAENERLTAALQRIDGINDNPAVYNPMIDEVLRRALENKP